MEHRFAGVALARAEGIRETASNVRHVILSRSE
jgi:hypothetical protein